MPLTQQRHYTVGYHDLQQHHYEICEYANDAYEAIEHAKEDVPELRVHPSFIDRCTNETGLDYIWNAMSAGVPMGR